MRLKRLFLLPVMALPLVAASWKAELEKLVKVEREFSASSEARGLKDAFLAFLADDGTLFRPGPVPGKKWMSERPAVPGTLSWYPIFADLSAAGDLGYTTGPYQFKSDAGVRHGNYFTIWKKQSDGTWKFVVDFGITNPAPEHRPQEERPAPPAAPRRAVANPDKERSALMELDDEFSAALRESNLSTAYAAWAANEVRVLRDGDYPAVGRREMLALLAKNDGRPTWHPEKADIAKSADLGYTWGRFDFKPAAQGSKVQSGYYVRVWRKQQHGIWRIVLDVVN